MTMNPTSDIVAVAWLATIPGLSSSMVSTNLPQDFTTWSETGFVISNVIAGAPDLYLPVRRPVVQVDCWAVNPNSGKSPWGKANHLAELVRSHVEGDRRTANLQRLLSFPQGDYLGANVLEAIMLTEPRRAITVGLTPVGDEASYAHYMFDLELTWRVAT